MLCELSSVDFMYLYFKCLEQFNFSFDLLQFFYFDL